MTSTRTQSGPTSPLALLHELADNWWLVLLRGIAAIAFGILAFFWPAIALLTLVFLWGTYAIVDGVFALAAAIAGVGGEVVPRCGGGNRSCISRMLRQHQAGLRCVQAESDGHI